MIKAIFKVAFILVIMDAASQDLDIFKYRNVGPSRGGRVTAVAGTVHEPGTFYFGATGGGVWKSTDYGTSWDNISDGYFSTPSIGAISVAKSDPNIVYVGTGSDGLRSNVILGKGMYKSIDAGKTWEHVGLGKTGQIGAVIIHPENYNIVYAAAIGNPFVPNADRGIFKSIDGGKSWNKVLYVSDQIGFSDVEMLPGNPEILFATAWKAQRKPWTIVSGGRAEEGGIYKSIDGGKHWEKITKGLPDNLIGKIDIAVTVADSKVVYVLVEAPDQEGGLYRSDNQGKSFEQVSDHGGIRTRPFYYTNIEVDPKNADVIYVMATGYYKSVNGGIDWKRLRPPHGDNHDMWINPDNPDLFIQANDGGANVTHNGGKTWSTQYNQPTAEIYQVEVDDQFPYWLYGGQQDNYTTVAVPSRPGSAIQAPQVGYTINTGGCETGPAVPKPGNHNIVYSNCKGRFSVFNKLTGTEQRYDVGAANMYGHNPKDLKFRFQRVSPIHVSPHDPDVVYHTSQFVHKTTDDGKTWEIISPDLTAFESDKQVISGSPITRDITGEEFYSTIYSIRESTAKAGVIWVGANDGPVHVSKDAGKSWSNVTPSKLPPGGRVDAVEPSPHDPNKAFVAVLRYQLGDNKPYLYKTDDAGKSWVLITNGIPSDYPTRVIREDPEREGLLYAGTEYGMFVSFDDGKNWISFQQNLPVTPITDIKVVGSDLAISTMGRSFWVLDNLSTLRQMDSMPSITTLFKPRDAFRFQQPYVRSSFDVPTTAHIDYFLAKDQERVAIEVWRDDTLISAFTNKTEEKEIREEDMGMNTITSIKHESLGATKGMNRFEWDMTRFGAWHKNESRRYKSGPIVGPGQYTIKLITDEQALETTLNLLMDPRMLEIGVTTEDVGEQERMSIEIMTLLSSARQLEEELDKSDEKSAKIQLALDRLQTAGGIYPQPKLVDQISYLYYVSRGADHRPGKDVYDRFDELSAQFEEIKQSLE
ncbi:MAG: hypothetical protein JXQ90_08155 [Cyclobacteriaceae bacterium]